MASLRGLLLLEDLPEHFELLLIDLLYDDVNLLV